MSVQTPETQISYLPGQRKVWREGARDAWLRCHDVAADGCRCELLTMGVFRVFFATKGKNLSSISKIRRATHALETMYF